MLYNQDSFAFAALFSITQNGVYYKNLHKDASLKDFDNFEWFVQHWMICAALNDLYHVK